MCTDTLTRRGKNDSLALSSTAATYVGFSVLPRSINIKSACAAFSIFVCMCAAEVSINTHKAFNCEAPLGLCQWKSAITIYTYSKNTHRGAEQSTTRPKPCIRVKAHSTPLPCYGIRPNPCLCTQCVVCVNMDTCNVQLKHTQFVLLLVSN